MTEPKDTISSPPAATEPVAEPAPPSPAGEIDEAPDVAPASDAAPRRRTLRLGRRARGDAEADPDPQETGVIERPPDPDQPTGAIAMPSAQGGGARLRRERRELMAKREEMLFHLGGLTFELYRAGRLGEAVARHRAGMVAEVDDAVRFIDAQLDEIRRVKQQRRGAVVVEAPAEAGACLVCRAPFYAEARFCMQCGARFAPPPPELLTAGGTQIIPVPPTEDAG